MKYNKVTLIYLEWLKWDPILKFEKHYISKTLFRKPIIVYNFITFNALLYIYVLS